MRPIFIPYILLISTCILAACGGHFTSSSPAPESTQFFTPASPPDGLGKKPNSPAPPTPVPKDAATEKTMPEGAMIIYQRSGGYTGLDEEWTIYSDGRLTAKDGRQWQSSPEQVASLLAGLEALDIFDLQAGPVPIVPCCDRFYYELTVSYGGRTNRVATYDGATATHPSVWRAMEAVVKFLEQIEKQPE